MSLSNRDFKSLNEGHKPIKAKKANTLHDRPANQYESDSTMTTKVNESQKVDFYPLLM